MNGKVKNWNIETSNGDKFLKHSHKKKSYFCIKINNEWHCMDCGMKAPEPIQYIAKLSFCNPIALLTTKDPDIFVKCYVSLMHLDTFAFVPFSTIFKENHKVTEKELLEYFKRNYNSTNPLTKEYRDIILSTFSIKNF